MNTLLNKIYLGTEPDESKGFEVLTMPRPPKGLIEAGYGRNECLNDKFGNTQGDKDGNCDCCDCDDCCGLDGCCDCNDLTDCLCCCG
jgi:hypothetical protein